MSFLGPNPLMPLRVHVFPNCPWDFLWAGLWPLAPQSPSVPSPSLGSPAGKDAKVWKEEAELEPLPLGAALRPCLAYGTEPAAKHSLVWLQHSLRCRPNEDTTQNFQLCSVRVRT